MHYYMYEIKNNINGKIYVGVHKTRVEDDGYMGSGKYLKRAIEKHGIENFTKIILERFDTAEEMFAREKEFVNDEFLARKDIYNLRRGGTGGFDYINKNGNPTHSATHAKMMVEIARKKYSKEFWKNIASMGGKKTFELKIGVHDPNRCGSFKGNSHTPETKKIIGDKNSIHQTGKLNSQFGSMWITDGSENKKIGKDENIPFGWRKGRIIKRKL